MVFLQLFFCVAHPPLPTKVQDHNASAILTGHTHLVPALVIVIIPYPAMCVAVAAAHLSRPVSLSIRRRRPRPVLARGNPGSGMWMTDSAQVGRWQIRLWGSLCGDRRVPARRLSDAAFWRLSSVWLLSSRFRGICVVCPIVLEFGCLRRKSLGGRSSNKARRSGKRLLPCLGSRHRLILAPSRFGTYTAPWPWPDACPPLAKRRMACDVLLKPVTVEPTRRARRARQPFCHAPTLPRHTTFGFLKWRRPTPLWP